MTTSTADESLIGTLWQWDEKVYIVIHASEDAVSLYTAWGSVGHIPRWTLMHSFDRLDRDST